jgi:hypothetical protein
LKVATSIKHFWTLPPSSATMTCFPAEPSVRARHPSTQPAARQLHDLGSLGNGELPVDCLSACWILPVWLCTNSRALHVELMSIIYVHVISCSLAVSAKTIPILQESGSTLVRSPSFEAAVLAGAGGTISKKSTFVVLDA